MSNHLTAYHDGLNGKLLAAVPTDARRVLELGCANGRLGEAFKRRHPQAEWWGVEIDPAAAAAARGRLDRVFEFDVESTALAAAGRQFDTVVIGDLLEHLRRPGAVLETLYDLCVPDARLVCCVPNMGHQSVIERLLVGDISYDEMGLLDATHTRFFSAASLIKTMLDSGWLPDLVDEYRAEPASDRTNAHLVAAAVALGLPEITARQQLGRYQMIFVARKWDMQAIARSTARVPVSVIVPVTRPWQLALNAARSPGLLEIGAELIPVQGASDAAGAFAAGAARASHAWRLFMHQDVYVPVGAGHALSQQLAQLEQSGRCDVPAGFAGLQYDGTALRMGGLVIDRTRLFDHPVTEAAVSLDELAIALHRDCPLAVSPVLGWHLWATDLCLQARARAGRPAAALLRAPLFHNSASSHTLPSAFHESARHLLALHPDLDRIPTLCGVVERQRTACAMPA
jgi:2-polyprenyl-3-methyl-5-hydroxy-6-metoxy-1,4-benzoquinol methylase